MMDKLLTNLRMNRLYTYAIVILRQFPLLIAIVAYSAI